ncbi:MAG: hypothetical protein IMW89_16595 [Ktedonobacteraceae bacterium]|nr:hypothetical protein [Ktedonobacteraceae bacterium]
MRDEQGVQKPLLVKASSPPQAASKKSHLLTILLLLLTLIALGHFIAVTHTAYPTVFTGSCSALIRNTDYTKIVQRRVSTQSLGNVQFVEQLLDGQPAALVPVIDSSPEHQLDVYIYGCVLQHGRPALTLLFKHQGIVQGSVSVTQAGTLSIGSLDPTHSQDISTLVNPLQQHVYREYAWRNGAFVQIPFAGLYPVTSQAEAEALQEQASNGEPLPWTDPLATAEQMARDILQLSDFKGSLQDNDGRTAHVLLVQQQSHLEIPITLMRLVQSDESGLWFVTHAQTRGITLDQSPLQHPVSSPITIRGTVEPAQKQTSIMLFDHALTPMYTLNKPSLTIRQDGQYECTITYTNRVPNQQGLLLIKTQPQEKSSASGQLLLTNILLG